MTEDEKTDGPPSCPRCQKAMVPVVYGYPGGDMFQAAERGEIVLGGCLVYDGQPAWSCTSCQPQPARSSSAEFSTVAEAWAARPGRRGPSDAA
jgi:hypothetical protein